MNKILIAIVLSLLVTKNVTAQTTTDVTLTWGAVSTDVLNHPTTVTGYKLYVSTSSFIPSTAVATAIIASPLTLKTLPLAAGTWYAAVSAYNVSGESARSNTLTFVVPKMVPVVPPLQSAALP